MPPLRAPGEPREGGQVLSPSAGRPGEAAGQPQQPRLVLTGGGLINLPEEQEPCSPANLTETQGRELTKSPLTFGRLSRETTSSWTDAHSCRRHYRIGFAVEGFSL